MRKSCWDGFDLWVEARIYKLYRDINAKIGRFIQIKIPISAFLATHLDC